MASRDDFVELLDIQGNLDLVSKSQLLEEARQLGARVSERQLTTYITEGLIPRSARLGERGGVYPRLVVELLLLVSVARCAGRSIDAIRELVPIWKYLARARREGKVELSDFEQRARQHVTILEAAFSVPWLFGSMLTSPFEDDPSDLIDVRRDGEPVADTVEFVAATQVEELGSVQRVASMEVAVAPGESSAPVVLGIPNGVDLPVGGTATPP